MAAVARVTICRQFSSQSPLARNYLGKGDPDSGCVPVSDMTSWKVYAIAGEPLARAKVVTERGTGQILGAQLLGAGAAENIHVFALAIGAGMSADRFKHLVFAYPTFASALESTLP